MIQFSVCICWLHEMCVGIAKDEHIGLWLCPTCRKVPSDLQNEITSIKDDVQDLNQSTQLIITAINQTFLKLQNSKKYT